MKVKVYNTPPEDANDLLNRIHAVARTISSEMLERATQHAIRRAEACTNVRRKNFEQLVSVKFTSQVVNKKYCLL